MSKARDYVRTVLLATLGTLLALVLLVGGWIGYTHHQARLDPNDQDDQFTAGKSIGLSIKTAEIHAEGVGFIDPTIYYQAKATPEEVAWLSKEPLVEPFASQGGAPLWWCFCLWWDGALASDMKYYRTKAKWPALFAYSRERGVLYGTVEFD